MSIIMAIIIEGVILVCALGIMFAGSMRTTGVNSSDSNAAWILFGCGTLVAVLVGASHWIGW